MVTQAFTTSMEEMIRRRIKEGNFSDVLPPAPEKDTQRENSGDEVENMLIFIFLCNPFLLLPQLPR